MKYAVFFLLVCVALAAAAPQYLTAWPGVGLGVAPWAGTRTLVTGPTVVNGYGIGGRLIAPGYVTGAYI